MSGCFPSSSSAICWSLSPFPLFNRSAFRVSSACTITADIQHMAIELLANTSLIMVFAVIYFHRSLLPI